MAEYDRRQGSYGGGHGRKRRFREDDEYDRPRDDRRGPRRQYNTPAPVSSRIRRPLMSLADSPSRPWQDEVPKIAHMVAENYKDSEELRTSFTEVVMQLLVEQPLKTPFLAAVAVVINASQPEALADLLAHVASSTEDKIKAGQWRDVKCYLKFLACLQGSLEGDGLFPLLGDLFDRAGDLQTASSDDTIGTELVKIILLTIPYVMAAAPGKFVQQALELMEKTEIIAAEPHSLHKLIDPFLSENDEDPPSASCLGLLQKQLQTEASNGWPLSCLPRPWELPIEDLEQRDRMENATKHVLPTITVPTNIIAGPKPLFPEVYFSVYADPEIESVPPVTNIASSLIRDALMDTINILDYNRHHTARILIDIDCYFADGTFARRATPYDRLRDVEPGRSTWKPEDVAVDTVFSQLFQLPSPEHKLVYYHSVLTEACKLAPAAIAPSLGRAIRYLYRNISRTDLELSYRFMEWFAHHLSNFGFTWKWTEWADDVQLSDLHPGKAFILGALDKEIRLSFASRIKGTLPDVYKPLIRQEKEADTPYFKFDDDSTPFAAEGREMKDLLKRKSPDEEIEPLIERIHTQALDHGLNPLVTSTDIFVTAVCHVGSKSLSHVLACIERTKDRLLNIGAASELARAQIISAVAAYWRFHPGVAICIIEKLLNYSILAPQSVVDWAVASGSTVSQSGFAGSMPGDALAAPHVFEMVFATVQKVTGRVRQVVINPSAAVTVPVAGIDGPVDEEQLRDREVEAMKDLFKSMGDSLESWVSGSKDEMIEADNPGDRDTLVRQWARRWQRVFRRRATVEEAWLAEHNPTKTTQPES